MTPSDSVLNEFESKGSSVTDLIHDVETDTAGEIMVEPLDCLSVEYRVRTMGQRSK